MSLNPESIGLSLAQTDSPGCTRIKQAQAWAYHDASGKALSGRRAAWVDALAIPPAWTDVWISPRDTSHILAFGYDAKGRRQYIYHPDFRAACERAKFEKLPDFAKALPRLRADIDRILDGSEDQQTVAIGVIVRLLDDTGLRIGNRRFVKRSGARGATTLTEKHVSLDGSHIRLDFQAKGGKRRQVELDDAVLAEKLRELQATPGPQIFSGDDFEADASDVNGYLQSVMGPDVSAKDFRTWGGSVVASEALYKHDAETIKAITESGADYLGNTPTIARNSYIHPAIIAQVKSDAPLPDPSGPSRLYAAERRCYGLITQNR